MLEETIRTYGRNNSSSPDCGNFRTSKVLIMPSAEGTGVINAGSSVRTRTRNVVQDVRAKSQFDTQGNMALALLGLVSQL